MRGVLLRRKKVSLVKSWNKGQKRTGDYTILLEDGSVEQAHLFRCQITGQQEWSRADDSYIYDNIIGWAPYDGR